MKNCSLSFTRRDWECFKRRLTRWAAYRGIPLNRNDFILRRYRNHFRGRPAFIVGNGPSLRISDLDMLRGHLTLASNKIYLGFEETRWRPHFLFMEDAKVIEQSRPGLEDLGLVQLMLPDSVRLPQLDALYYHYHWMKLPPPLLPNFGSDPLSGFFWGFTITYTMIQWAYYLGVREIYLIGIDFRYAVNHPQSADRKGLTTYYQSRGELNHFHKDYYPTGTTWMVPDLEYQGKAFEAAGNHVSRFGGAIYNSTRGGALEVFPRRDFDDVMRIKPGKSEAWAA